MQLIIRLLNDKVLHAIDVEPNATLLDFKMAVKDKLGVMPHELVHLHGSGGKRLSINNDDESLADLRLRHVDELVQHFVMSGGNQFVRFVMPDGTFVHNRYHYSVARLKAGFENVAPPEHLRFIFNGVELFNDMTLPMAGVSLDFYTDRVTVEIGDTNLFKLDPAQLVIDRTKPLGSGSFGVVFPATLVGKGGAKRDVAVKVLKVPTLDPDNKQFNLVQNELCTLCRLAVDECESVVRLHGYVFDVAALEVQLVMELATHTLSDTFIKLNGAVPNATEVAVEMCHLWEALSHMHRKREDFERVLHLDISPNQVLQFTDGRRAKLCDFGLATSTLKTKTLLTNGHSTAGTQFYKAPEQWSAKRPKGIFTDIYAFGGVLWSWLRGGEVPWSGHDAEAIMGSLLLEKQGVIECCGHAYPGLKPGEGIPADASDVHKELAALAAKCLQVDPEMRASHWDLFACLWKASGYVEVVRGYPGDDAFK